jgi:hypothetical protein
MATVTMDNISRSLGLGMPAYTDTEISYKAPLISGAAEVTVSPINITFGGFAINGIASVTANPLNIVISSFNNINGVATVGSFSSNLFVIVSADIHSVASMVINPINITFGTTFGAADIHGIANVEVNPLNIVISKGFNINFVANLLMTGLKTFPTWGSQNYTDINWDSDSPTSINWDTEDNTDITWD